MTFTAKDLIGGIDVTAPLWNKTEPRELHAIVAALSDASYHYADDSGKEWSAGNGAVQRAAKAVNAAGLGHYAITCLHRHTSQLVTLDRFMDAILKDARPASPDVRVVTVAQLREWENTWQCTQGDRTDAEISCITEIRAIIGGQP